MLVSLGRPTYHVVAERGWMNDPCAPGYDPSTGIYHLMYQWNPNSHIWADISWGAATSKDLITWEYTSSEPVIKPEAKHNEVGIFTGSMYTTAPDGGPGLSIFYTSATHLPIGWTIPHTRGAEGLTLLTSGDGGKSWQRYENNPVIQKEPDELHVTGFRDPAIFQWPALSGALKTETKLFAVLSGGVQGDAEGPRMFLYGLDPTDLTKWTFIKTLGTMERNISLDRAWSGDFGCNWECGTFIPLQDQATGIERMIGIVGVEGGHLRPHAQAYRAANPGRPQRGQRYCNWFFANLGDNGDIGFETTGMMDWGDWYAPSVFLHPDGRSIAWGWIVEEDLSEALAKKKGWIGCLGIPRELGLGVYQGVTGTSRTPLAEITSLDVEGTKVVTLDIRPMRGLEQLRRGLLFDKKPAESGVLVSQAPDSYEILLTADIGTKGSISLCIRESSDVKTTISFINQDEQLVVHRDKSSTNDGICLLDEIAKLSLFSFQSHTEALELRVFVDKDVVEVFANGRVAISTRIYAPANASGISLAFDSTTHVTGISAWELGDIGLQGRS